VKGDHVTNNFSVVDPTDVFENRHALCLIREHLAGIGIMVVSDADTASVAVALMHQSELLPTPYQPVLREMYAPETDLPFLDIRALLHDHGMCNETTSTETVTELALAILGHDTLCQVYRHHLYAATTKLKPGSELLNTRVDKHGILHTTIMAKEMYDVNRNQARTGS
jgi:hypothetical protein